MFQDISALAAILRCADQLPDEALRRTVGGMAHTAQSTPLPPAQVIKSDEQWREQLTPAEYRVLRQAGTEAPYAGEYTDNHQTGVYSCRACGSELFRSDTKFESHCGWPSFFAPELDSVRYIEDKSLWQTRTEVRCATCDSHLGHVFTGEGYDTPTDRRYCINSTAVKP